MSDFFRPATLAEALEIRANHAAVPLAGGTDLLVRYRNWAGTLPKIEKPVVSVGHLSELRGISVHQNGAAPDLSIGAGVTYGELLAHPQVPELLKNSIWWLAAPGLRNVATLAGNLCNASPAADAVCALYALDATVDIAGAGGTRRVPVEEFITGPGRTVLRTDELVTAIHLRPDEGGVVFYQKVGTRKANALSKLSICARASVHAGVLESVGIAVGAVAPTIVRSRDIEATLIGRPLSDIAAHAAEVVSRYEPLVRPISDQRSTAEYRKATALGLIGRFLMERLTG